MISLVPLEGIPEIRPGDDLAEMIAAALAAAGIGLTDDDVLVVTQKVVSKAEGRVVDLSTVEPRAEAREWAERWGKDPRQVELVLRESAEVVRMADGGLIISRTRHGFVCANAGVDLSNTGGERARHAAAGGSGRGRRARCGSALASWPAPGRRSIISDSFGRPWRSGIVNVAIGSAGIAALDDLRGTPDADGREMRSTIIAVADRARLRRRPGRGQGRAATRGAHPRSGVPAPAGDDPGAAALVMPREQDLFP